MLTLLVAILLLALILGALRAPIDPQLRQIIWIIVVVILIVWLLRVLGVSTLGLP